MTANHVPIRTCLGCGQRRPKDALMRIVIKDSALVVDTRLSFAGRGAYLCPDRACINLLLKKKGRLSHALRAAVPRGVEEGFLQGQLHARGNEE
jgi:predicted RNA-binding protein YlxR (DUF448 family)